MRPLRTKTGLAGRQALLAERTLHWRGGRAATIKNSARPRIILQTVVAILRHEFSPAAPRHEGFATMRAARGVTRYQETPT
ncbi:hypothetical protein M8756_04325 [Lutimaribacter sp. EGI FJ00015]|uniref:Uncharacterized protein n=1 Tax=Lutimaribacter degradans TaxID=2945989 RepID=A0ACC5ZQG6_9RHOB|nr:hypothetical protein [Lutimaribacter sp. EGI FJ00013]MCM2560531.1 hypothetical protein [Lutimaribacter sp. EGI FJ00013]MCO0612525.1 hypothetical protein [Lutimaribacter sp. EGI FJ00015]MCO0634355.1 hypothetical protein [Lutimaribacter sp. EGI FJ00014]